MLFWSAVILLAAAYIFDCAAQSLYYVHMLQLNSYRHERFLRWMKEKRREIAVRLAGLLASAAVFAFLSFLLCGVYDTHKASELIIFIVAGGFLAHGIISFPRRAKKPLVFTARVKRLLATHAVLYLAAAAAVYLTGPSVYALALLLFFSGLAPFVTLLAGAVNAPAERAVSQWYVRDAARRLSEMPGLTVIGITGSYGKTSVKNYLHDLLAVRFNVLMTPESYNTTMGVVRTVRERLLPTHEVFIAEMGAKNRGDIREICDLVHPRYGIITAIGEQHLETFGSIETIIETKFELAEAVPGDGAVFLNADNEYIAARKIKSKRINYSIAGVKDGYRAEDLSVGRDGSSFTVITPGGESRRFTTRLLGRHTIQNLTGCIAVAHTLGIPLAELVIPVRQLKPVPHRLQLLPNGFIDDAYNSNPAGFRAALDVLGGFGGQRVLVTPGMVELGERQDVLNREAGQYAASRCDYAVLVGERQAPPLKAGLLDGGFEEERIYVASTLTDGLSWLDTLPPDAGRVVLLENDLPDNF